MRVNDFFRAFQSRNYNLFFAGQLVSRVGMWMQRTAVIWLVYTMTHSVFMVGVTTFAEQFPSFLLSPLGGITADRYNRYRILMMSQVLSAIQALALALVYYSGSRQVWTLLLLSVVLGIANAFDVPARQPMVNDIVKAKEDLPNAIALTASMNNLARLIGPGLAGFVLARYGAGICFVSNAASFLAVIVSLMLMRLPVYQPKKGKKNIWKDFSDGFHYARSQADIAKTLTLLAMVCFLIASYNTLLPFYAKDFFSGNAATYGYINAFIGGGAILSTIILAASKTGANPKRMLFINLLLMGAGMILFSHLHYLPLFLVLSAVTGFGVMSVIPICNTVVQLVAAPHMRGRVIGFFAMAAFGALPLGSVAIGWISEWAGVPNCILAQGILSIAIAGYYYKFLNKPVVYETEKIKQPELING